MRVKVNFLDNISARAVVAGVASSWASDAPGWYHIVERRKMNNQGFEALMWTIAQSWSTGEPRAAADCFTEDVVYVEPPDRQHYAGRDAVYELSGGDDPSPMTMTWHHLVFDAQRQIGVGEYTFRGRRQFHGIAIVELRDGRISRWREYQYQHDADWLDFIGDSRFIGDR